MMVRHLGDRYAAVGASASDTQASEEDIEEALHRLPSWLHSVPGLDVRSGIKRCGGSASDYLDALALFAASIDEKTKTVRYYLETNNDTINTLRLHSLKSSARLVGAVTLAEQAAALELAGKVGNHESLESGVEALIAHYQEIEKVLNDHLKNRRRNAELKAPISDETLSNTFSALRDAAEKEDFNTIDTLLDGLDGYLLESKEAVLAERLRIARRKENLEEFIHILDE